MALLHDINVSSLIKEQLPEFVKSNPSQNFKEFLEAYYEWLELVQVDLDRDVSELFYKDQICYGDRSGAQALIVSIPTTNRMYVRYLTQQKFLQDERLFTEGLSWDDLVEEHADRFDEDFWSKSPGTDYTAGITGVFYNAILATSYMLNLQDIDTTDLDIFQETYRDTLLAEFPELEEKRFVNERQLAKMIRTFNNRKGVDKTIKFLFKLVYGEDIDVFFPNIMMLRTSDGKWDQPIVTFLGNIPTQYELSDFVGMRIRGKTSNVEALVINSYKNQLTSKEVNVLVLEGLPDWVDETSPGIPGNPTINEFIVGEEIEVLPATFIEEETFQQDRRKDLKANIRGGVANIEIYAAGSGYAPGQPITLTGQGGAEAKAEIRLVSNNYAVDYINVNSQGTGYQIGDEVEWQPAFSGGKNQSAEVGSLQDEYVMYHSYQQMYPYKNTVLSANAYWTLNSREAANTNLYYTIILPEVYANGATELSHNLMPYPDYEIMTGQNVGLGDTGLNAEVITQEGNKQGTLRVRLFENNFPTKADHPILDIDYVTSHTGQVYDRIIAQGDVHSNVEFKDYRIDDAIVYVHETFGGVATLNVTSTGIEFFDIPGVTVLGRSNTGVYSSWTSNTDMEPIGETRYSTSAFNVMTITTDQSSFVFANGFSNTDPDYPDSRIDVMELVRTGMTPADQMFVYALNPNGMTKAELVGVLDLESIAYFVQEDYDSRSEDSFFFISEEDATGDDRFVAEGDSVVLKVLFDEDTADPFFPGQTMQVRDAANNFIMQFDATLVSDFRKMGTDGIISVPYLATNSIFDISVLDPGSDYGIDFLPVADTNTFGNQNAILIPHLTGTIKYEGRWLGYDGMLDSPMQIQDSYYWQDFSYSIRSGFEIQVYRDMVKRLVHIAGTQLFGELLITINVNAQMFSGGEYGGKYNPNYLIDANSHTMGPFGGPFQDRPFFNLEREFLFTGPDGTVSPFAHGQWQANTEDQYAHIDGRLRDLQINHEPIPHDGLFHANGQPVTYVVTPGKRYNNPKLNELMDRFIVENPSLRPEGLLMEEQTTGPGVADYIYSEFNDVEVKNQFLHGQRINWTEFRRMRETGEIIWVDYSLDAPREGFDFQVPDDSFEGAWYRVDLEGSHIICEEATGLHSIITEESNQDLYFPLEEYNPVATNGATIISQITNSSEVQLFGVDFNFDHFGGIKVGQEVELSFTGFEPRYKDSGYNIEVLAPYDEHQVAVEPAYEELRGQILNPSLFTPNSGTQGQFTWSFGNSSQIHFMNNTEAGRLGFSHTWVNQPVTLELEGIGSGVVHVTGVSGVLYNIVSTTIGFPSSQVRIRRGSFITYEGRVNLTDTSGTEINRATFTATIDEIGLVDPAIESLTVDSGGTVSITNQSVYKFNQEASTSNYYVEHISGPVLDFGGPTDIYGGSHNAIIRQNQDQIIELETTTLTNDDYKIIKSDTGATVTQDTFLGRDLGGQTAMDVYPGYNYGEFELNGQTIIADVRYRGNGAGIWNTVAAGLAPGDYLHAQYVGHSGNGTAQVLHIDHSSQIIYMKGGMVSWSQHSYTDKDISKREILPVESIPMTTEEAVYNFYNVGGNRYKVTHVSGEVIDFGGPTDRFNQGFETTIRIEAPQTVRLHQEVKDDYDNVISSSLYAGAAQTLKLTNVEPYVETPKSNGTLTYTSNGAGNFYHFDNVSSAGMNIGDTAYITGFAAGDKVLDFKAPITNKGSVEVRLPDGVFVPGIQSGTMGYTNVVVKLYGISPADTGTNDHLNTTFNFGEYTFTPTGSNNEYEIQYVAGTELNFGNENEVYGTATAETTYLDPSVTPQGGSGTAFYLYSDYGPFTGTITDIDPAGPIITINEDITGAFLTTNVSVIRQAVTQTFTGTVSHPFYFRLENDSPGAAWDPISFEYPYWAMDGTVFAESQHEIENQLPIDVTTWNFFNPLYDEERNISDYDGTVFRDWRDNPTTIYEPYRYRYDEVVATSEVPSILDFYFMLESDLQDHTGELKLLYEDGSIWLKESYNDDWASAVEFTEANGAVHMHRDWFAFTEPTIVYHNKDFVSTEVPVFLRDMGDFKPIPAPTIDMAPSVAFELQEEIRGHGLPLDPTEFNILPLNIPQDFGNFQEEHFLFADMEMNVMTDLGDFNIEEELKVPVPLSYNIELLIGVGISEMAIKLPLGKQCGRLVAEDAGGFYEPLYETLIATPESHKSDYYPKQLTITEMTMIQETMDALLYEDGGQLIGETMTHDYVSVTNPVVNGYVKNHWFFLEDSDQVERGDGTDPLQIGGYFPKSVTTSRGQGVGFLEMEDTDCGQIPIEYHKEIYSFGWNGQVLFTADIIQPVEYSMYANLQIQQDSNPVEIETVYKPYMHPTEMYVTYENRVQDYTYIPYGLQSDNFGYHYMNEDLSGYAITFEDGGYILDERIPEAVRTIRYDWELVDRQFIEYGRGSDFSRSMRGWGMTQDQGDFELDLLDPPRTGLLAPTMLMPGIDGGPQAQWWFQTEDGDYYLIGENGEDRLVDETPWWAVQPINPRHVEIELILKLPELQPPLRETPFDNAISVGPITITSDFPEFEMPTETFFFDASVTLAKETELDLAEFRVATIWYNFPQSPVYRWYDENSDIRAILDGVPPTAVEYDNYMLTEDGNKLTYEDGSYILDQVDTEHQPKDIGICFVKPIEETLLTIENVIDYDTATIYTYYEPEIFRVDEDLQVRAVDEPIEVEHFLFAPTVMVKANMELPRHLELELDMDNSALDVLGIVLPIHEEHDPVEVGTLIAGSEFLEPSQQHELLIDVAPFIIGQTGQAPELLGFVTQIPTIQLDLSFEALEFDTDIVATADVFPYSAIDRGPNSYGLTPYDAIWTPIGDTALVQRRDDVNGLRINTYDSYPVAKQQDSDFAAANNSWSVTAMFNIDTMTGINDGQNRGNQSSSKWDPMWIWSQARTNEGPGFRFGINNRFMVFAYGDADAGNTFITRLKLEDDGNFNQNYRTRINEWYSITITYNGKHCGAGINEFRQDLLDTEDWVEGTDDIPTLNQFRFYKTDLQTGLTTELLSSAHPLAVSNVTVAVPEGFTVGASGPETLRSSSNTGSFSTFYEHGLKVGLIATHNKTLSIREIEGTFPERRSGFALDPVGWKYTEDSSFVFVNNAGDIELEGVSDPNLRRVTANTTQIWHFGSGRNDGFVQQGLAGIHSSIPDNQLVDNTVMNPYGLFLNGENTTNFTVGTTYGIHKDTPDFGDQFNLYAGDISSMILRSFFDPFIANNQHISAQGAYTFAGNVSSVKTEYDFEHTGITADVSNLVPYEFFPLEIAPVANLGILAYGDPLMGGNSALNNSNSQILLSIDYDWSTIESDIDRRVLDHQQVDATLDGIPLNVLVYEFTANAITADPDGSIISDVSAPGRGSASTMDLAHTINTTSLGRKETEISSAIIQYGRDRMLTQGDDIRLHGLIVEEPLQFILAEEDDTPLITEIYEGEEGLATETDVFIIAEGTYDTMILDSEIGGEPFFLQTETGIDLDLELFEDYGDSIIAGYDTLHDFVLTERHDTVQNDDWILTHDGHTIIAEDPIRATDSEIILDSISNPRTIADIAFDDFERFDTHDGVSTLD